jgi:putative ATP-dependent endonuclease of OLD family
VPTIRKLVLKNFKRFRALELDFDPELNILVGGNEAGKSSVLQAIDIVLSASRSKVETLGKLCAGL